MIEIEQEESANFELFFKTLHKSKIPYTIEIRRAQKDEGNGVYSIEKKLSDKLGLVCTEGAWETRKN